MTLHTRLVLLMALVPVLAACAAPAASRPDTDAAASSVATAAAASSVASGAAALEPAASSAATFAVGTAVAGIDVGGLTHQQARQRVDALFDTLRRPVTLHVAGQAFPLDTTGLLRLPDAAALVEQAARNPQPADIPFDPQIDRQALQQRLTAIARLVDEAPAAEIITDTDAYSSTITFVRHPGCTLDVDAATEQVAAALADPVRREVELELRPRDDARLPFSELQRALEEHATYWRGTVGVYVYDLDTGEEAGVNRGTVFSGASVLKVPIMIYVYSRLGTLNEQQRGWMERMIGESRNYEATKLLAAAVGGWSTDDAFTAVTEMSAMLRDLGFEHTYMLVPYEGSAYLRREDKLPAGGPAEEGDAPFTAADPYLRTTPAEIARLFAMLDACAAGGGPLIEQLDDRLDAGLCSEMLAWLRLPHDPTRMAAGVPPGVSVAHKGGWTSDMQADVGIVESPGGRYVASIWIYRDLQQGYVTGPTAKASPYLADFSHTIYSFYNPETPTQ